MRLNEDAKKEFRKKIEEKLEKVSVGERIHLDKQLLEELIFETSSIKLDNTYGLDCGKKVAAKYIVWSGIFLQKIDLSEVSFEDVVWDSEKNSFISLNGTNAKIDFSKSFDMKWGTRLLNIRKCDFSYVDLSNNCINFDCNISDCTLDKTGLRIDLCSKSSIKMTNCSLLGVDLSAYVVNEYFFFKHSSLHALGCDLSGTGLKINMDTSIPGGLEVLHHLYSGLENKTEDEFTRLLSQIDESTDEEIQNKGVNYIKKGVLNILRDQLGNYTNILFLQRYIGSQIKLERLNGCYVNGKKILYRQEKEKISQEKQAEYETFKLELLDLTLKNINEQIDKMK